MTYFKYDKSVYADIFQKNNLFYGSIYKSWL